MSHLTKEVVFVHLLKFVASVWEDEDVIESIP